MTNDQAIQLLTELGLSDWEVKEIWKTGGQGATVKVYNQNTNKWGVLKYPKKTAETDINRAKREIEILREIDNNNTAVVQMLASSLKDDPKPWLITELGQPFTIYWNHVRENTEDFDSLILKAVNIITHLCEGLSVLHMREDTLIHRDIKPDNIVVIEDTPKLIDFGVAFWKGKERLTDAEEAVGNRRFSPDVMMYRQDEVNPWVDVFMLSQVFMWMIADGPIKKWDRPWDYRFVRYPAAAKQWETKIFAITGLCSEENLAPKNVTELKALIEKIFHSKNNPLEGDLSKIVDIANRMAEVKTQQFSQLALTQAELNKKLDATKFMVAGLVSSICDKVMEITDQLQKSGVNAKMVRRNDEAVLKLADQFKNHQLNGTIWSEEVFAIHISSFEGHLRGIGLVIMVDLREIGMLANPFKLMMRDPINEYFSCYIDESGRYFKDINMKNLLQEKDIVNWFILWLENPGNWQ